MKNKPKFVEVDYDSWKSISQTTLYNIHYILESVKILLDKNIEENKEFLFNHPYVAAGMYTFAIEEYGKFLLLNSIKEQNGIFQIKYKDEFRNHPKKFQKALENIPEECRLVHSGGYTNTGFTSNGFNTDVIADFETRLGIFYSDFGENKRAQLLPQVDLNSLSKALEQFTKLIKDTLQEFNLKHFSQN